MNRIANLALAVFLASSVFSLAEEPKVKRNVRVNKTSMNFANHLQGAAKWQFKKAGTLMLEMDGDSTLFKLNGGKEMFRLDTPEYIDEAVLSEDGQTLILVAMKTRGFGSDFATLIQVRTATGKLEISRVLESGTKIFDGDRWWLSELGAVSDDGGKILAKFGVSSPDSNRMGYRWYTVGLPEGKILSEGLTIANSKKAETQE